MPTYQYACKDCGHAFEQVQSFSEDSLTVCPQCEGRLRKVFNAVGVVFKGSGFYRNDSRDSSGGSSGSSSTSSGSSTEKSESTSGSTSDTKSETKTETKSGTTSDTAASKPSSGSTSAA